MYWSFFRWAKEVALDPAKNTKKDMKYEEFVKRLVVVSLVSGVMGTILTLAAFSAVLGSQGAVSWASAFASIPIYILAAMFGPFVNAAISHFFGKYVFRLMKREYKKTYNAYAYSAVPGLLLGWIPLVGGIVAAVWSVVVGANALSNQQKISKGRALVVILIPIVIVVFLAIVVAAIVASFFAGALVGSALSGALSNGTAPY